MTETTHRLTDRERLVLALDELATDHGYLIPNVADLHCCLTCVVGWIDEESDGLAVGWHHQADEAAFGHGFNATDLDAPDCVRCTELDDQANAVETTDGCPECSADAWRAARYAHVLDAHHHLVGPLGLQVRGDRDLVVTVLRRHGLRAELSPWNHVEVSAGAQP